MNKKATVVTITGIRPDFIRMKNVFREFDKRFHHIMVHTGQHYDDALSKVFFQELDIRKPDFTLSAGLSSSTHYEQLSYLSSAVIKLFKSENISPDLIVFLGDSNSALAAIPLFKEGYKIAHIEGGMRSYDRRMPEEVNRVCCDYVSDMVFVYTPLYKERLIKENKPENQIFVVGNTITEIVAEFMPSGKRSKDYLLADIHRNENLHSVEQYMYLLNYLNELSEKMNLPVKLVRFNRAIKLIGEEAFRQFSSIELVGPCGFLDYLQLQYNSAGVISDSGTSQEECPLLQVPVVVPRNFTERPESVENGNSLLIGEHEQIDSMIEKSSQFISNYKWSKHSIAWLGDGTTSKMIGSIIQDYFER